MHFQSIITILILASGLDTSFAAPVPPTIQAVRIVRPLGFKGAAKVVAGGAKKFLTGASGQGTVKQANGLLKLVGNAKALKAVPVVPAAAAKGGMSTVAKIGGVGLVGGGAGYLLGKSSDADEVTNVKRSPHDFAEDEMEDTYEDSIADLD